MLRFAADENFNMHIVGGVLRLLPNADIVRVQDAGLSGVDDQAVLSWAASQGRILLLCREYLAPKDDGSFSRRRATTLH
jgi:hypothetical protein